MFELCLTKLIESYLVTRDNQVGFKKKPSTDIYIFSVKSVIIQFIVVLQVLMEYVNGEYCHPYYFLFTWMISLYYFYRTVE